MLEVITFGANFFGLAGVLWLGFYLVTRNPRSRIAWLTGLMLWSVGGMFLNILLALTPPPDPSYAPRWFQIIFPFWHNLESGGVDPNSWLLGWTIGPAIVIWHHVTTVLRGEINAWRSFRISAGYLVAILAIYLQYSTPWLYTNEAGDPLYINTLRAGALYPIFGVFILLFAGWSFVNLYRSSKNAQSIMLRKQFDTLSVATFVAALSAPISLSATYFKLPVPILFVTIPILVGIFLAGYSIARYSALVEGRTLRRDFLHSALGSIILVVFYLLVTAAISVSYELPTITYVAAMFLALVSYSFFGLLREALDQLVYEKDTKELRRSLRLLNRLSESEERLDSQLSHALDALSSTVRASFGLLYVFDDEQPGLRASYNWTDGNHDIGPEKLLADDVAYLQPNALPAPYAEAALLLPLYVNEEQTGAILLGRPANSDHFSSEDIEVLLDPSDTITDVLYRSRLNEARVKQIKLIAKEEKETRFETNKKVDVRNVEMALRNITDYAYLGDSPLVELSQVQEALADEVNVTHIDAGKAVYRVLIDAIEKLHPDSERPRSPVPREWYPYIILYDAYLMDVPNRDIMSGLYISEGTFNRTRRAALRTVARLLEEIEATN